MNISSAEINMNSSANLYHQNEYSKWVADEMKMRIVKVMKFLRNDLYQTEVETLMLADLHSIFPILEQYLKDSFLMIVHLTCASKKENKIFLTFTNEVKSLFSLIDEQLFRMNYVIIPCVSSIASMMYYVEETFVPSLNILMKIFANYFHLRSHILDCVFKKMTLLQPQNLAVKNVEKMAKSFLLLMQSILANSSRQNSVPNQKVFEQAEQQYQSLTTHWISLFVNHIEHQQKILNNFVRHVVKMLNSLEYPSAFNCSIIILRIFLSCLWSAESTMSMKKFALELSNFIIINLKKMVNSSSNPENTRAISSIREHLKLALPNFGNDVDIDICIEIMLIRFMEEEFSNTDSLFSPVPFVCWNFTRHVDDRNEITSDRSARKRKLDDSVPVTDRSKLRYYSRMLESVSYKLQREDADIIYHYLVSSRSELRSLVDLYFEKVISTTSLENNSLRLSAVKQIVPLFEVNNNLCTSRIFKHAVGSLVLDRSVYVRENILLTLGKIVLLYKPFTYAVIFEENFNNILMRVMDVNVSVRKAAINLLTNFCIKNRNHRNVLKMLACILSRILDKSESVRFETVEILKQLWFTPAELGSTNSIVEIIYLSCRNSNNYLIHLFNYIFRINTSDPPVPLFDVCFKILTYVAYNRKQFIGEDLNQLVIFIRNLSQNLTAEDANNVITYMHNFILPELKKPNSNPAVQRVICTT